MNSRYFSIEQLLRIVRRLPASTPDTEHLFKSGYESHQAHWVAWLDQYNTGGFYDRSDTTITDARTVYQRLNCAPMIIWLADSLSVPPATIGQALMAYMEAGRKNEAAKAAAVRRVIPWETIAARL